MKKIAWTNIFIVSAAFLILGCGLLGLIRNYAMEYFIKQAPAEALPVTRDMFEKWIRAVEENDISAALLYAGAIVPEHEIYELPPENYLELFHHNNIPYGILNRPFDKDDFNRWRVIEQTRKSVEKISSKKELFALMRDNFDMALEIAMQSHYVVNILIAFDEAGDFLKEYYAFPENETTTYIEKAELKNWDGETPLEKVDITENGQYRTCVILPYHLNDFKRANQLLYKRVKESNLIQANFPDEPFKTLEHAHKKFSSTKIGEIRIIQ